MSTESKPEDLVIEQLQAVMAGEAVKVDAQALTHAIRCILGRTNGVEDHPGAVHRIGLAALQALNSRLRAQVECAKVVARGRLQ